MILFLLVSLLILVIWYLEFRFVIVDIVGSISVSSIIIFIVVIFVSILRDVDLIDIGCFL